MCSACTTQDVDKVSSLALIMVKNCRNVAAFRKLSVMFSHGAAADIAKYEQYRVKVTTSRYVINWKMHSLQNKWFVMLMYRVFRRYGVSEHM